MKETPAQLHRIEALIGRILQWGVGVSAITVAFGGATYLWSKGGEPARYHAFRSPAPGEISLARNLSAAVHLDGSAIIRLGLCMLIATPVIRVAFSLLAFLHERDWLYVACTVTVLCVLGYGLIG